MNEEKSYRPSSEEFQAAEDMLTPEQRDASRGREILLEGLERVKKLHQVDSNYGEKIEALFEIPINREKLPSEEKIGQWIVKLTQIRDAILPSYRELVKKHWPEMSEQEVSDYIHNNELGWRHHDGKDVYLEAYGLYHIVLHKLLDIEMQNVFAGYAPGNEPDDDAYIVELDIRTSAISHLLISLL